MNELSQNRQEKLAKIYAEFEFGYDVAVTTHEDWVKTSDNVYTKKVYLEFIETASSLSNESVLTVVFKQNMNETESIKCILVGRNLSIGSLGEKPPC